MKNVPHISIIVFSLILAGCSNGGSTANTPPTASNVSVTDNNGGYSLLGDTLTGSFTYSDAESDVEGVSTFRWLRDGVEISGATNITYNIIVNDVLKDITFEVTPIAATGETDGSAEISSNTITIRRGLNDTGITLCGDYAYTDSGTSYDVSGSNFHNNNVDCAVQATVPTQTTDGFEDANGGDIIRAGQDALYGRDATNDDDSNGHAGFNYTKLDANGDDLLASATSWSCVRDNITGLIWENKTSSGLQNSSHIYTWYNSTSSNEGDAGLGDTGNGIGSDNCTDDARCDTEKYIADVNASNSGAGLCGASNWRLPSKSELISIVNNGTTSPSIDSNYFPNTELVFYWTSVTYAYLNSEAWLINFDTGRSGNDSKSATGYSIRLVHDIQ